MYYIIPFTAVSVAFKFGERDWMMKKPENVHNVWQKYLLKYGPGIEFNRDSIQELEAGLKFGSVLKLPAKVTFNSPQLLDFMCLTKFSQSIMPPLSHLE